MNQTTSSFALNLANTTSLRRFRLGLIINPFSGIGGAVALKGSDGLAIREQALALGAKPQSNHKTAIALQECVALAERLEIITVAGEMGETLAQNLGFQTTTVFIPSQVQTEADDTIAAAKAIYAAGVDCLLFAGGDGTARNICSVWPNHVPALGVPAGCKIHSGVYAISPKGAGKVIQQMVTGELVSAELADVRDIDEEKFRAGTVIAKHFGELLIPSELQYVQAVKMGGKESDELVLADLAAYLAEIREDFPGHAFIMGSGSTVDFVMQEWGFNNTLLGVDVIMADELIVNDATATDLEALIAKHPCKLVITLIGGQGHIFGRGNQQLSPQLIRTLGKENILVVATKTKLEALAQRPLHCDTGDSELDDALSGNIDIITGYRDHVLYRLGVDYVG
jgi:predicted polyphosphate/ATP-dependent NAD kinase